MGLVKNEDVLAATLRPDVEGDEPQLETGWDAIKL